MLLELTIIPIGQQRSISETIAPVVKIIEKSGLDYQMTAFGTLVEGTWDKLMSLAKDCHLEVRQQTGRVLTMMRIDDYGDRIGEIAGAVDRVEQKVGKPLKR